MFDWFFNIPVVKSFIKHTTNATQNTPIKKKAEDYEAKEKAEAAINKELTKISNESYATNIKFDTKTNYELAKEAIGSNHLKEYSRFKDLTSSILNQNDGVLQELSAQKELLSIYPLTRLIYMGKLDPTNSDEVTTQLKKMNGAQADYTKGALQNLLKRVYTYANALNTGEDQSTNKSVSPEDEANQEDSATQEDTIADEKQRTPEEQIMDEDFKKRSRGVARRIKQEIQDPTLQRIELLRLKSMLQGVNAAGGALLPKSNKESNPIKQIAEAIGLSEKELSRKYYLYNDSGDDTYTATTDDSVDAEDRMIPSTRYDQFVNSKEVTLPFADTVTISVGDAKEYLSDLKNIINFVKDGPGSTYITGYDDVISFFDKISHAREKIDEAGGNVSAFDAKYKYNEVKELHDILVDKANTVYEEENTQQIVDRIKPIKKELTSLTKNLTSTIAQARKTALKNINNDITSKEQELYKVIDERVSDPIQKRQLQSLVNRGYLSTKKDLITHHYKKSGLSNDNLIDVDKSSLEMFHKIQLQEDAQKVNDFLQKSKKFNEKLKEEGKTFNALDTSTGYDPQMKAYDAFYKQLNTPIFSGGETPLDFYNHARPKDSVIWENVHFPNTAFYKFIKEDGYDYVVTGKPQPAKVSPRFDANPNLSDLEIIVENYPYLLKGSEDGIRTLFNMLKNDGEGVVKLFSLIYTADRPLFDSLFAEWEKHVRSNEDTGVKLFISAERASENLLPAITDSIKSMRNAFVSDDAPVYKGKETAQSSAVEEKQQSPVVRQALREISNVDKLLDELDKGYAGDDPTTQEKLAYIISVLKDLADRFSDQGSLLKHFTSINKTLQQTLAKSADGITITDFINRDDKRQIIENIYKEDPAYENKSGEEKETAVKKAVDTFFTNVYNQFLKLGANFQEIAQNVVSAVKLRIERATALYNKKSEKEQLVDTETKEETHEQHEETAPTNSWVEKKTKPFYESYTTNKETEENNGVSAGFTFFGFQKIASMFKFAGPVDKYTGYNPQVETKDQKLIEQNTTPGSQETTKAEDTANAEEFSMERLGKVLNAINDKAPQKFSEIRTLIQQSSPKSGDDLVRYLDLWSQNNWNGSAALRAFNAESTEERDGSYFWSMYKRDVLPVLEQQPYFKNAIKQFSSGKTVEESDVNTNEYK